MCIATLKNQLVHRYDGFFLYDTAFIKFYPYYNSIGEYAPYSFPVSVLHSAMPGIY